MGNAAAPSGPMKSDCLDVDVALANQNSLQPASLRSIFFYGGILSGFVLGVYEAALVCSRPRYSPIARADLSPLIFLAAPLLDLSIFALLGLVLGYFAERSRSAGRSYVRYTGMLASGLVGGFACALSCVRLWWDLYPKLYLLVVTVITGGVAVSVASAAALRKCRDRALIIRREDCQNCAGRLRIAAVSITVLLFGCTGAYEISQLGGASAHPAGFGNATGRPNIILITLDTATAEHFSCYGYGRPTTPNLDWLAKRGVQFENAISPSSWTLPSFASMFTGLYPHQHGADSVSPLAPQVSTLAQALKSSGYQTAGFNANAAYGQASQGIARGFDVYLDGSENLRQNMVQTLFGRTFTKFVYLRFTRFERPEWQHADEINRKVEHWLSKRSRQPYFLFINYFDVHAPYFAARQYVNRFGGLPSDGIPAIQSNINGADQSTSTPAQQAAILERYDDALAYTDNRIGALIESLAKSPDWSNTVVIVTSDHGETLGQHGVFGHGMNLWRELVHVPLIILGSGIPQGVRIHDVVGTRSLYATILGLAAGRDATPSRSALQSYWTPGRDARVLPNVAVSELGMCPAFSRFENTFISVTTPQWHYILDAHGQTQLFNWVEDPQEKLNLTSSPEGSKVSENFRRIVREQVMSTNRPWRGLDYLQPVGLAMPSPGAPPERDVLDSLPYQ